MVNRMVDSGANDQFNRGDHRRNRNIADDEGRRGFNNKNDAQASRGTSFYVRKQSNHPLGHRS